MIARICLTVTFLTAALSQNIVRAQPDRYFAIEVIDAQTGRGVPMVELKTTSATSYYTDSNGLVAFNEPGLIDKKVFFSIESHGYEFPADAFGIRGVILQPKPGGSVTLKINRLNIAQRLYRITGQGIYRDTVLLGRKPPIDEPLINAQVTGQDGILNIIHRSKLYWFYGDTLKLSYPLGNFAMTGATTDLPDKLDPQVGINLHYFTQADGFVKSMAPVKGEGVVWLFGVVNVNDESGHERMLAMYQRRRGLGPVLENGFMVYNDDKEQFEKLKEIPLDPPVYPTGYPSRVKVDGVDYIYFTAPYPVLRCRADYKSYLDLSGYEVYTCLNPDGKTLDRDETGKLIWAWKKNVPPLNPAKQQELIKAGKMKLDESPERLTDIDTAKPILLNNCSCFWNDYRKKYIMIASQSMGATMLGEVYFAESDQPQGPWTKAKKIITHANKKDDAHDFYNPTQHPFLDKENGKIIYLEGSYVNTFSGNPHPTPYYEYNQIMYKLDLSDPRLTFNH